MKRLAANWLWLGLSLSLVLGLAACESPEDIAAKQGEAFLASIELIEGAGRKLQQATPGSALIDEALQDLDDGLAKAYEVEHDFLARVDARLTRLYQQDLLKGVEDYRIGVESGVTEQQLRGMMQLQKWHQFWQAEGPAIRKKIGQGAS